MIVKKHCTSWVFASTAFLAQGTARGSYKWPPVAATMKIEYLISNCAMDEPNPADPFLVRQNSSSWPTRGVVLCLLALLEISGWRSIMIVDFPCDLPIKGSPWLSQTPAVGILRGGS